MKGIENIYESKTTPLTNDSKQVDHPISNEGLISTGNGIFYNENF